MSFFNKALTDNIWSVSFYLCALDKLFFVQKDEPLATFDLKEKTLDTNVGPGPKDVGVYFKAVASTKEIVVTGGQTASYTPSQTCFVYSIEKKT